MATLHKDRPVTQLDQELQEFFIDRRARNLTPKTLHWYTYNLTAFAEYTVKHGIKTTVDITPRHIRRFLIYLVADGMPTKAPGMAESRHIAELQPLANEARQRMVDDRQDAILHLFATFGQMGITDLQERLKDDRGIDVSLRTLRSELQAMEANDRLTKLSRGRWDAARSISAALPTMETPVLNGAH